MVELPARGGEPVSALPQQQLAAALRMFADAIEAGALTPSPAQPTTEGPRVLTREQAATELQISLSTLDRLTAGKSFRSQVGRVVRIDRAGLMAWWSRRNG